MKAYIERPDLLEHAPYHMYLLFTLKGKNKLATIQLRLNNRNYFNLRDQDYQNHFLSVMDFVECGDDMLICYIDNGCIRIMNINNSHVKL